MELYKISFHHIQNMSETTYYQINREVILNRAKDYYENNKKLLTEREQKINTENYLKRKKYKKRVWKKRYHIKRVSKKLS